MCGARMNPAVYGAARKNAEDASTASVAWTVNVRRRVALCSGPDVCATARLTPWIDVVTMGLYVMLDALSTLESAPYPSSPRTRGRSTCWMSP